MKSKSLFPFFLLGIICLFSCSKEKGPTGLLTQDTLKPKQIEHLKKKNFLEENENIVYLYSLSKIKNEGILLTDKKILVYNKESTEKELLENIFDMSTSHSLSVEQKSTIKVYRKDDTEFSAEFFGGTDADEKFFLKLKALWREAISKKQG